MGRSGITELISRPIDAGQSIILTLGQSLILQGYWRAHRPPVAQGYRWV